MGRLHEFYVVNEADLSTLPVSRLFGTWSIVNIPHTVANGRWRYVANRLFVVIDRNEQNLPVRHLKELVRGEIRGLLADGNLLSAHTRILF